MALALLLEECRTSACSEEYVASLVSQLQDTLAPLCEGSAMGGCAQALNATIADRVRGALSGDGPAKLQLAFAPAVAAGPAIVITIIGAIELFSGPSQEKMALQPSPVPAPNRDNNGVEYYDQFVNGVTGWRDANGRYYASEADLLKATGTVSGAGLPPRTPDGRDVNGVPYYNNFVNGWTGWTDGTRYYTSQEDYQKATAGLPAVYVDSNTVVTRTNGNNVGTYTLDSQSNVVSIGFSYSEYFSGVPRSSAEIQAQADAAALGLRGDQGGHYLDFRYMGDQGDINLFPQAANFNLSAYKVLGNDYARFIDQGYTVQGVITPGNFNGDRPGTVDVGYRVFDQQGNLVDLWSGQFQNEAGQTYVRRVP